MKILVTGGAGFIGSRLCMALSSASDNLTVLDNFSSGAHSNLRNTAPYNGINVVRGDCKNPRDIRRALRDAQLVFHFAANPEVRLDHSNPSACFQDNIYATSVLLEELRDSDVDKLVYASSSTVYGDAKLLPTPENYAPLEPISYYGASKLASEGLVSAFCHTHGITAVVLRFANIIGPSSKHGIIKDLLTQIRNNSRRLRILGDGHQSKSYLHIEDCISGILQSVQSAKKSLNVFNVGSSDQMQVKDIASIILEESGMENLSVEFTGGTTEGRGWNGDVKNMLLDVSKLRSKGWRPRFSSEEAVRMTVRALLHKPPVALQQSA